MSADLRQRERAIEQSEQILEAAKARRALSLKLWANHFRDARHKAGVPLGAVAKAAGITAAFISAVERGESMAASAETRQKLIRGLREAKKR